jgi:broad specificity phosphatase PhoE
VEFILNKVRVAGVRVVASVVVSGGATPIARCSYGQRVRLLLIRHGQTPANVRGELDTAFPGPGLTPLGRAQAAAIPGALVHEPIDAIFVSTLVRTAETAAPLADALSIPVVTLPGIHEIFAGDLEMATDHASYRSYLGAAFAWGTGDRDRRLAGAENGHEFFARFDASIASVAASGAECAVVVSHGAAIRVWVAGTARDFEPGRAAKEDLDNTALVVLNGSPTVGWTLENWGGDPLGGHDLDDETAPDPTGEAIQ